MAISPIEWTDETHNPGIYGCSHYGVGCAHCYAERLAVRLERMGTGAYAGATRGGRWTRDVRVVPVEQAVASILGLPRRRSERPVRTFVTSMGDMLHEQIPTEWTARVLAAMAARPDRVFQVLTHRGQRWPEVARHVVELAGGWPGNVWAGVSASTQAEVDREVPGLLEVPGLRFLSLEPLLGAVERISDRVSWVIVGGESGPGARPMNPRWARSLRDQCVGAGVPFFLKQWGEWAPWDGDCWECPPGTDDVALGDRASHIHGEDFVRVGKKAAGRLLDGRTWDEMPAQ